MHSNKPEHSDLTFDTIRLMKSSKNTLYLAKLFKFMDFRVATRFVDDIASIALAEKVRTACSYPPSHL